MIGFTIQIYLRNFSENVDGFDRFFIFFFTLMAIFVDSQNLLKWNYNYVTLFFLENGWVIPHATVGISLSKDFYFTLV